MCFSCLPPGFAFILCSVRRLVPAVLVISVGRASCKCYGGCGFEHSTGHTFSSSVTLMVAGVPGIGLKVKEGRSEVCLGYNYQLSG